MMPPIICIIGKKNSGKTTLAVLLVAELAVRGYVVMTVKHGHGFELDHEGTDSWRHRHEGGAARVAMVGPHDMAVVGSWGAVGELPLSEIVNRFLFDADVVIAEGFKRETFPVIEVYRRAVHEAPIFDGSIDEAQRYLAIVVDEPFEARFPVLQSDDPGVVGILADIIVERALRRGE